MALLTQYNPARVLVTFFGGPIRGYAPGTFINARRDAPVWKTVRGTNAEMRRVKQKSKSGTVSLTLRHSHPLNQVLGGLVLTDEISAAIVGPLTITDLLAGSGAVTLDAYIAEYPPLTYSQGEPNITWTFVCETLNLAYPGVALESFNRV